MSGISDRGFAANFDHSHIWYKNVSGYNFSLKEVNGKYELTEDELKRCIAGDRTVNGACLSSTFDQELWDTGYYEYFFDFTYNPNSSYYLLSGVMNIPEYRDLYFILDRVLRLDRRPESPRSPMR